MGKYMLKNLHIVCQGHVTITNLHIAIYTQMFMFSENVFVFNRKLMCVCI